MHNFMVKKMMILPRVYRSNFDDFQRSNLTPSPNVEKHKYKM